MVQSVLYLIICSMHRYKRKEHYQANFEIIWVAINVKQRKRYAEAIRLCPPYDVTELDPKCISLCPDD